MVGWRIALWAVIVLAALLFLYMVRAILAPFVLAILLSIILDPAVRKLRYRGMSRPLAVWVVMGCFIVLAVGAGVLVTPTIVRQIGKLNQEVSDFVTKFQAESGNSNFFVRWNPQVQATQNGATNTVDRLFAQNHGMLERLGLPTSRTELISRYIQPHQAEISRDVESSFTDVIGFVTGFGSKAVLLLFTPIFTIFILLDLERFRQRSSLLIPPSIRKDAMRLFADIGDVFGKYLRGVATVLFYYLVVASIVLTILGAPYSILLAVLFTFIYLIPILGPVLIAILLFLITMLSGAHANFVFGMSSSFTFALVITLVYAAIMTVFDQLVYARVVGRSVGLHPVVSFFVVFSGAALFGPIGMILAFPIAGSAKVILDRLFRFTSKDGSEDIELPAIPFRHRATVS